MRSWRGWGASRGRHEEPAAGGSPPGRRARPYQVRVRVRVLDADEWDRVLDAIAAQIGHAAALLDGELLPEVADDVRGVGTDLLPGPGELQPRCSCPDWADPCKHAAAVCYLVAGALDADPFSLLLLRGRRRDEVLAGLRARRRSAGVGVAELAAAAGMPSRELLRWGVTWQLAGRGGLEALRTTWQPAATDLVEGRAALDRLAGQDAVRAWRNRVTCGG